MPEKIDHHRFIALLKQRFPEVAAEIDDCAQGLLSLGNGGTYPSHASGHRRSGKAVVREHFHFIDKVLRDSAPDVENAIYVSYLEHLRFEGRKAAPTKARELLTPRLQQALAGLEE